jgi:hypothetical protein
VTGEAYGVSAERKFTSSIWARFICLYIHAIHLISLIRPYDSANWLTYLSTSSNPHVDFLLLQYNLTYRIILVLWDSNPLDWHKPGYDTVKYFCEHVNISPGYIKCGEYADWLSNYQLLRNNLLYGGRHKHGIRQIRCNCSWQSYITAILNIMHKAGRWIISKKSIILWYKSKVEMSLYLIN